MTMAIEDQIERFAPGFRDLILARVAHDTAAMERHNPNNVGGDISGGHSGLVQFIRRPTVSPHPWATPLPGVYLCSASTPPGAAVHGMGGYHAARLALARLLSRRAAAAGRTAWRYQCNARTFGAWLRTCRDCRPRRRNGG
jgi:phytoene dehydrogenase-like protein